LALTIILFGDEIVRMLGDMRLGKIVILLLFTLISGVLSKEVSLNEEASERRFSARQVFDYNQPILFESDFGGQGFNKWKLSEDDRYGLAQANPDRLRIVDAPGMVGGIQAVRFFVPRKPNSFRTEISLPSEKGFNERWYGILSYVPQNWKVDPNEASDILIQWHAIPGNWRSTYPNLSIRINNSNWQVGQNFGSPQKNPERKIHNLDTPLELGEWVAWIIHANWSPGKDGLLRIWKEGEQVLDQRGANVYGTIGKEYTPYLKTGIYHPEWNLNSDARKKRYEAEIPGISKKETYVCKVIVGGENATYEMIASRLAFKKDEHSEANSLSEKPKAIRDGLKPWSFVSIPDFLNFDIEYPQKGWEDALGFIVGSMKKENPAFAMVAGDLVMGHWGTQKQDIDKWAEKYYPGWVQRFKEHGLKVYAALGDHEIRDNPWRGTAADAVPFYKDAFRRYLKMPPNGPDHMKGTAFYWLHQNVLFVSVDVFEEGQSKQGEIAAGVTGKQLEWFERVVRKYRPKVDHIVVMGHTPILRPVRTFSSSGMLTVKGRDSDFWKTMVQYGVDLYLCGEVHAVTCTQKDGIQQVAHGGLIGRTTKPNYMVVTVHDDKLELNLKEIDLINGTGRLWQKDKSKGPWDTITITKERKKRGFTSIGKVTINKQEDGKRFDAPTGFFLEKDNP